MAKQKPRKLETLFDPSIEPENYAGNERIAKKALDLVNLRFDQYDKMRMYIKGGVQVEVVADWDEKYRIYNAQYNQTDHNYDGTAKTMTPALRRSVNVIYSEASNALFSREDYFSVDEVGAKKDNIEMARRAFGTLKYFSDRYNWVKNFGLATKQCLIYDATVVETVYRKYAVKGVFRKLDKVPVTDPTTGSPMLQPKLDDQGKPIIGPDKKPIMEPVTRDEYNIYKVDEDQSCVEIEARDIYNLYINHATNDPEQYDIIYRDSYTAQDLIEMRERGIYNAEAVDELLKMAPSAWDQSSPYSGGAAGDGKTFIDEQTKNLDPQAKVFEVLRFQGFFTIKSEDPQVPDLRSQFWIDIGERKKVLRVIENPLIGQYKTFSMASYDAMIDEFYSGGIIGPSKDVQYQIDDKENQSLDALTYNLNAPVEVTRDSGIKASDILEARRLPNKALFVKTPNSIRKITVEVPLNHLNNELVRLNNTIDLTTGATSLAAGAPTGTQADRSGKALGILSQQTRSQFSDFVRRFENQLIERAVQKAWNMIVQFIGAEIEIEIQNDNGPSTLQTVSIPEIVGHFNVRVAGGSQYLKQKEIVDSIMQFMSILSIDDTFRRMVDRGALLKDVAAAMPYDMSKYIDPGNAMNQLLTMVDQLQAALQAQGGMNEQMAKEIKRLTGVIKQTDRAQEASPPMYDKGGQAAQASATQKTGAPE